MIHILLRYLGIKTKLLDDIYKQVNKISNKGDVLLDLFAGSNVVGQSLCKERIIYSNDIQKYSYVVGKATIEINHNFNYKKIDINKVENSIYFKKNMSYLLKYFNDAVKYEFKIINNVIHEFSYENLILLKQLYENTPYTGHYTDSIKCFSNLEKIYSQEFYDGLNHKEYYMLFSLNYAMPYFSLNQALYIDSFRYAIEKMKNSKEINNTEYYVYLSLLIYALECSVTSIGDHFAQPQIFKLSSEKKYKKGLEKLILKKRTNLHDVMMEKQQEFNNIEVPNYNLNNKCFNMDCIELLKNKDIMKDVDVIYMDPPYTNAHYSRFYHILETLINYNYPKLEYNGRYSNDRYQSPFCQKKQAKKEFEKMIKLCAEQNKKIIISYSDTKQCLINYEDIKSICNANYKKVNIEKINYLYRNLGQKPNKVNGNELIIVCEV